VASKYLNTSFREKVTLGVPVSSVSQGEAGGSGKAEEGRAGLRTVKVREETYRKLMWYRHVMEMNLLAEGKVVRVTMDDVISTLIALLESAKVKVVKPREGKETNPSAPHS
jgi:hypothetical protein